MPVDENNHSNYKELQSYFFNTKEDDFEILQLVEKSEKKEQKKENRTAQKYNFVCAIDFGSTYSGYAYASTKQPDHIRVMRDVSTSYSHTFYQKIPTALLLDKEEKFVAFGYEAKQKFQNMDEPKAAQFNFFDKFKMKLYNLKNLNIDLLITASNGTFHSALKVFSLSLGHLKRLFLEEIRQEFSANIEDQQIKWVLTVPSIWLEESKQFMRLAAYEAGIGSEQNPNQLQIALEPEAASLYCRSLRIRDCLLDENFYTKNINNKLDSAITFNKYIIMDCGGGTVDVSVHELDLQHHHIKELNVSVGEPVGGLTVDRKFENILRVLFGECFIERFKKKYPMNWLDLLDNFDIQKRCIKAYSNDTINIPLPYNMVKFFKKQKHLTISQYLKSKKQMGVTWSEQGALLISYNLVKTMFMDAIYSIITLISHLMSNPALADVKNCFLVGGFSNAFILQNELRKYFRQRLCIITPTDSSLSTLRGAVLFGLDCHTIKIRRSSYSYGVRCLVKFDETKHDPTKKMTINNVDYCKDIFHTFVKVNDSIGYKDKVTKNLIKHDSTENQSSFLIYRTKNLDAFYVTDEDVEMCAKFTCDLSHLVNGSVIRVVFYFGKTQIKVKALDAENNELVKSQLQFFDY